MSENPRVWMLEVATFRGVAPGAQHSYGTLKPTTRTYTPHPTVEGSFFSTKDQAYTLERVMTAEQARELNALNERFGRDYAINYSAGDQTHQYDTDAEVHAHGIAVWREVCDTPDAVLLCGSGYGYHGPCLPLAGPEEVVSVLKEIWDLDESETSNDWTEIREEASKRWDEAIKRFDLGNKRPPGTGRTFGGAGAPKDPHNKIALVTTNPDGTLSVEIV